MTKIERLKIYKKMLRDYRLSNIPIFGKYFKDKYHTDFGFCVYFFNLFYLDYILADFIEINKLKPKETYNYQYWFKPGSLSPRIELLKKAISDTKMHIEIERLMLEK
jgi:hypothetical protein